MGRIGRMGRMNRKQTQLFIWSGLLYNDTFYHYVKLLRLIWSSSNYYNNYYRLDFKTTNITEGLNLLRESEITIVITIIISIG